MKKILFGIHAALLALFLFTGQTAFADSDQYWPSDANGQGDDSLFSAGELDELLAPVALYPDPLLAQILPAATFTDQIDEAARYVRQFGSLARIDEQPWDVSVKAVAHYPDLLFMMDQKDDWTASLGQAYVNQQQEVMDAIQRLRAEAEATGNLVSNSMQQVVSEDGFISIDPADPGLIFVPQYDPVAVYAVRPSPGYGFITFGVGFSIGAWLNRDCDWHGRRIYYHGWQGRGWISRARPYVQIRNSVYVGGGNGVVTINRRVTRHDTARYREEIRSNVRTIRDQPGHPPPPARVEQNQRGPASAGGRPNGRPDVSNVYRGRDIQRSQPASQSGYGGYGSSRDAASYRERGQASRRSLQQFGRPAPAQRPSVSGGSPAQSQRPAVQQAPRQAPSGEVRRQR